MSSELCIVLLDHHLIRPIQGSNLVNSIGSNCQFGGGKGIQLIYYCDHKACSNGSGHGEGCGRNLRRMQKWHKTHTI